MAREWRLITNEGFELSWLETWRDRLLHRFPLVNSESAIWLKGELYIFDPNKQIRIRYRPKRFFKLIELEDQIETWREGNPNAIDPRDFPNNFSSWTSRSLAIIAKNKKISETLQTETDWKTIALILLAITTVFLAIALMGANRVF